LALGHRPQTSPRVGEFDGNEFGEGECVWYMYGPDADALYRAVEGIIREAATQAGRSW